MSDPAQRDADTARAIVDWYARVARDLPWRREPTPYAVLLSEVMLQQTRVDTVVPYFQRFVARWPDLAALAAADDDEVLAAWAGLGYYRRARSLLACARAAAAAGGLPATVDGLTALPGIGPYTAGAIASIAFGVATPIVDGNVERVVSRLDARADDPRKQGKDATWARAAALVHARPAGAHPGALNQGLMELGATVCTPRAPTCPTCPVASWCAAARDGDPERYPVRPAKAPPKPLRGARVVIGHADGRQLLARRPPGLLGGLWEPLGRDWDPSDPAGDDPADAVRQVAEARAGVALLDVRRAGEVIHVFTHRRLVCDVFTARIEAAPRVVGPDPELRWVRIGHEPGVGLSTLCRKILDAAADAGADAGAEPLTLPFAAEPGRRPPADRRRSG